MTGLVPILATLLIYVALYALLGILAPILIGAAILLFAVLAILDWRDRRKS